MDPGGVKDHGVIDLGQLLNAERNRLIRVYKRAEPVHDLPLLHPHGANLDNVVGQRRKSCSLNIKHHVRVVQILAFAVFHQLLFVVHQIPFHPVDHLKRILFIQGMAGVRKCLNAPMVRNGQGRHAPLFCPIHQILHIADPVHIAHFGVAVELHPLDQTVVRPLVREILALFQANHRTDGQLPVKLVNGGHAFQLNKLPLGHGLVNVLQSVLPDKQLHRDGVRKIGDVKDHDGLSAF